MRDIPVFTTQYGAASLILKEIPYRGIAYIKIQDSQDPEELLKECVSFCRAAGAERVCATGHTHLENYPLHASILRMTCSKDSLPDTDAALFPVQEKTTEEWRCLYNQKMEGVDNSAYLTVADAKQMLSRADAYFVHRDGTLLGIGIAGGDTIDAVISVVSGAGRDVLLALSHAVFAETISVEVASTNKKAIKLYESLGFVPTAELSRWYKII